MFVREKSHVVAVCKHPPTARGARLRFVIGSWYSLAQCYIYNNHEKLFLKINLHRRGREVTCSLQVFSGVERCAMRGSHTSCPSQQIEDPQSSVTQQIEVLHCNSVTDYRGRCFFRYVTMFLRRPAYVIHDSFLCHLEFVICQPAGSTKNN